jgi:hypothetical protein
MIVRQGRVIICKTGAHYAAEGRVARPRGGLRVVRSHPSQKSRNAGSSTPLRFAQNDRAHGNLRAPIPVIRPLRLYDRPCGSDVSHITLGSIAEAVAKGRTIAHESARPQRR